MKNLKQGFICVWFQIGVNIIGIPDFIKHEVLRSKNVTQTVRSKYHS